MIFENSTIRQFGENSLIINYKAKEFYKGQKLEKEDFDRLFQYLQKVDIYRDFHLNQEII